MAFLRDVIIKLRPKLNTEAAAEEAAKMSKIAGDELKKVKTSVSGAGKTGEKFKAAAGKGIAILDQIQSRVLGIYNTVRGLTGEAGAVADLAYSLGHSEEQLIGLERAFGLAGMGSQDALHSMIEKFQQKVGSGDIILDENQDILGGFMDFIGWLNTMDKEAQDMILEQTGFGRNNVAMKKIMGSYEGARENLQSQENIQTSRAQGQAARGFAALGDTMEFMEYDAVRNQMVAFDSQSIQTSDGSYANVYTDAIKATNVQIANMIDQARKYQVGNLETGMNVANAIDAVQNVIPGLLVGILTALIGPVEQEKMTVGLGPAKVEVDKPQILTRIENIGTSLVNELSTLAKALANFGNNYGGGSSTPPPDDEEL